MNTNTSRVIYYVTSFDNLDPLIAGAKQGSITHALISLFHLGYNNENNKTGPYVHLNNNVPSDPIFDNLWSIVPTLKANGTSVMASLGGGGVGDYGNLFSNYSTFYPLLKQTLLQYNLQGLDLDIEEYSVTTANVSQLVSDLRNDMPSSFTISSAPVASALTGGGSVSPQVNYNTLLASFDWYNLQFYNGWGSLDGGSPDYSDVVQACGEANVSKLVAGVLTNPNNGSGYIDLNTLTPILQSLASQYPTFGGVDGWNYANALNAQNQVDPLGWSQSISKSIRIPTHTGG
ncbi:MAG: hypothetical protein KF784_14040 [Fimbriimonadaceae bacterium]|nr:hypothetical protein [Fimbriimonadaceae bacterium]